MSSTLSSASTKKKKELPVAADNHDKIARASEKIRCYTEEADGGRSSDCWEDLPTPAVHRVCLMAGDASAMSFCATCKAYRAAQPPLHVLSLGVNYQFDECLSQESLQKEFCFKIAEPKDGAHRVVEALSSRHAREITHLFMVAIHDYDYQTEGPKALLKGNLESYGEILTSLQTLIIVHPPAGHTHPDEQIPRPRLNDCTLQLVRATTDTLKALKISAQARFGSVDARMVVEAGGSLHYLDLNVVPWAGYPVRTRGREEDTISLRRLASERCTSLLAPAQIICHSHRPPWQPLSLVLDLPPPIWPNDERQAFFETHQQCLTRCAEEDESPPQPLWHCPEGYSGAWCGNLGYCTGAPSEPLDPACFASPLG